MSVFSGSRPSHAPAEYTAVQHDDDATENLPCEHAPVATRLSLAVDEQTSSHTTESQQSYQKVNERSKRSSEEVERGTVAQTIAGWPCGPRRLDGVSIPYLVGDALLILLPVAFLVLAITAWRLNGEPLSKTGQTVQRVMSVGPTIYPLAFAAIGGRCLRAIAIRLAERGTTISMLEKLLGSQSVVSAVGTAFTLRSLNLTTIALLFLWALSPLGGQSSLRLLQEANKTITETGTVYYSDPAATTELDEAFSWFSLIPTVLGASVAVSEEVKNRPVDLWGHPKIPRLDLIEQDSRRGVNVEGDWISVSPGNQTYSSWVGVNVQGLRPDTHAAFQVKSNYMLLDCKKLYGGNSSAIVKYLQDPRISVYPNLWPQNPQNYSQQELKMMSEARLLQGYMVGAEGSSFEYLSFFLKAAWNSTDGGAKKNVYFPDTIWKQESVEFWYGAKYRGFEDTEGVYDASSPKNGFQIHSCTQHVVTVDAHIECHSDECQVTKLRNTASAPNSACLSTASLALSCLKKGTRALSTFLTHLPRAVNVGALSKTMNPFDDFIGGGNVTYQNVIGDYTRDLSRQASAWGIQTVRASPFEHPAYPWTGAPYDPERFVNVTEATFTQALSVYQANIAWVVCLLLISTVLLLLAVANVAVCCATIAPDLFSYASSLARENPYTNTPHGGSALDGAKRSRLLGGMRVQIADVSPESEVGYVALKSLDEDDDFRDGKLRKDKTYW
ncbi:hypothetical protein OPT61_g9621 [Boeremia exigua]|uniref:Uncharacterized protein n=1 Tax=Boeremia exigua TaxID=749465 RepID=A0ACC2HT98_9PLEO|nr:hypothetical protein OPT61_g9621 [Boeremia exigua]